VRQALADDDLLLAETLLGHPFTISGRVVHGDELGRTIGFPTANLPLRRQVSPVKGVYAVEVTGLGDKPIAGVANIGTRPTVAGASAAGSASAGRCNGPLRSPYRCNTA
jgi:riboflavin kinase/FMN adenylyltransferase